MGNYTIIGGDKKEYGPVTAEEIRQWLAEGRLDGASLVRGENDTEWRPLATFLEFATRPPQRAHAPPTIGSPLSLIQKNAVDGVKTPAIGLIISSVLSIVLCLWALGQAIFFPVNMDQQMAAATSWLQSLGLQMPKSSLADPQMQNMAQMAKWATVGGQVLGLAISIVILAGAFRMLKSRSYEFAMVAAVAAVVPCLTPCLVYLLFLPFGIWALVALRKPGVKSQFL